MVEDGWDEDDDRDARRSGEEDEDDGWGFDGDEVGGNDGDSQQPEVGTGGGDDKLFDALTAAGLAAVGMAVGVVGGVLVINLGVLATGELTDTLLIVGGLVGLQIFGLAGTALAYLRYTGKGLDFVRLTTPSLKQIAAGFGGFIALFAALVVLSLLVEVLGLEAAEHGAADEITGEDGDPTFALYLIPLSILVIGPCEELLFRGVIQTRLKSSFSVWGAIAVTSIVFALVHVPAYGGIGAGIDSLVITLSILTTLSLLLGWMYERTNNLIVPIIAHGFYNAIQFAILYVGMEYVEEFEEMANVAFALVGYAV